METNMKNRLKPVIVFIGALLLLAACSPDNPQLGSIISANDLDISVTQNPDKDNIVYLENKTPGIIPFWDYGIGYSNENKTTIEIRFAGEHEITFHALENGGSVSTSRKITVTKNDEDYFKDPMWNLLTNGSEGKTWVWNDKVSACFGNGGQGSIVPEWWQVPYSQLVSEGSEIGEMEFNLNGAENFTKTLSTGTTSKGFFSLDVANKRLTILNSNILHGANYGEDGANGNYYVITRLTETEMTLARQGDGWQNTWVFRVK